MRGHDHKEFIAQSQCVFCFSINIFILGKLFKISILILIVVLFSTKILKIFRQFWRLADTTRWLRNICRNCWKTVIESFHTSTCPILLTMKIKLFLLCLGISSYFQSERYLLPPWSVPVPVGAKGNHLLAYIRVPLWKNLVEESILSFWGASGNLHKRLLYIS